MSTPFSNSFLLMFALLACEETVLIDVKEHNATDNATESGEFECDINESKLSNEYMNALCCIICMERLMLNSTKTTNHTDNAIKMECGHHSLFHRDCLIPWLRMKGTCPICRDYDPNVYEKFNLTTSDAVHTTKCDNIFVCMERCMLLFVCFGVIMAMILVMAVYGRNIPPTVNATATS